jgi:hypothetical protein
LETEVVDLVVQYWFIVDEGHEHIVAGIDEVKADCMAPYPTVQIYFGIKCMGSVNGRVKGNTTSVIRFKLD